MTTVREDILEALREYEEEERKRLLEEALRKAEEAQEERRREEEERQRQEEEERQRQEEEERQRQEEEKEDRSFDIAKEAGKGFIKGIGGAMFDIANGATFGGAKKFDEKYLNGEISKFDEELEDTSDAADVGNIYRGLKNFNEGVGAGLAITGAKNIGGYGLNEAVKYNGRRDLIKQLERGNNFKDINFGKMDKDTLKRINEQRFIDGQEPINSQKITIPASNVEHIYKRRIIENGYTPQQTQETLSNALFKPSQVYQGKPIEHQIIVNKIGRGGNMAVVDRNLNGSGASVITAMKRRNINSLEGRQSPSSVPSYQDLTGSKLSTPQTVNRQDITPMNDGVNSLGWENLVKNFEDTSSAGYVAQNKFMPQNNLGQAGDLSQNPYSHILQSKREKEDLEELLRRLKLLRGRW